MKNTLQGDKMNETNIKEGTFGRFVGRTDKYEEIKIIDNCCSLEYLNCLKQLASMSENWNMRYPAEHPIEDKFLKLDILQDGIAKHHLLAGLALGLLLQIYEAAGATDQNLFIPEMYWCGISIKDKHTPNNTHSDLTTPLDYKTQNNFIKIIGLINNDWEETWGGGFFHNGTNNYIKPTSFCIFDATKPHAAEEIFTDKKRFAIDFTVFRDQESLDVMKRQRGL